MKLAQLLSLVAVLAVVAVARPTYKLKPLDWTAITIPYDILTTVAAKNDLLVFGTIDITGLNNGAQVRRLNAQGEYVEVAFINSTISLPLWTTNGKWMASAATDPGVYLYSIDENNVVSSQSYIYAKGGNILSDDTYVALDPNKLENGNFTVRTWEYNATISNWTEVPNTALEVPSTGVYLGDSSSYKVSDTHLVLNDYMNIPDNCSVLIHERNADKSWKFLEKVSFNCSLYSNFPGSPTFNGNDTLVIGAGLTQTDQDFVGIVFVYTKINGVWQEQVFTPKDLGYSPVGYMGLTVLFLDQNTMLVSVVGAGYQRGHTDSGTVLMLTRDENGLWKDTLDLQDYDAQGFFGMSIGMNDQQLLIPNILLTGGEMANLTYYTAPLCFYKPVNVSCMDVQLNDCSDIDPSTLYTINNPECGEVNADISSLSWNSAANKLEATVAFMKELGIGTPVTCTASITCPAPPITVNVPVAVGVPSARTSAAVTSVQSTLISVLIFVVMFLTL